MIPFDQSKSPLVESLLLAESSISDENSIEGKISCENLIRASMEGFEEV